MKITSQGIFGKLTDDQGRCIHYHSPLDIIANKCGKCGHFYACYKCHDELEDHKFEPLPSSQRWTVMCGVCGRQCSYDEYSKLKECPDCKSSFNPKCAEHKSCYVY